MINSRLKVAFSAMLAATALTALPAHAGKTLDAIKAKGQLVCGVNTGLAGFSQADAAGNWTGIDADTCKAIAAAFRGSDVEITHVRRGGARLTRPQDDFVFDAGDAVVLLGTQTGVASLELHLIG